MVDGLFCWSTGVFVCSGCRITLPCRRNEPTKLQGLPGVRKRGRVTPLPYDILMIISIFQIV